METVFHFILKGFKLDFSGAPFSTRLQRYFLWRYR